MLRGVFLLLLAGAALAQSPRGDPVEGSVNAFPLIESGEAIRDRPQRLRFAFRVFFPVDRDRYLPVHGDLATLLSIPPMIRSEGDVRVRVLNSECRPLALTWETSDISASATGGLVVTEIEVTPGRSLEPGVHEITLGYPMIDMAFAALESKEVSPPPAEVRLRLQVWASAEARQDAARRAQEEKRRQEALKRAAELRVQEAERRRQEIAAREARAARLRSLRQGAVTFAPFLPLGFFLFLRRQWIWPGTKMELAPGGHVQLARSVQPTSPEKAAEPGTILQTVWARSFLGRRQRIKVETLMAEGGQRKQEPLLDLLVSVGRSVRPGYYLARKASGDIRVRVKRSGSP